MRQIRRIASLILVFAMLATSFVFADAAAIVSPAANSIVYADSLLVSVKVTELRPSACPFTQKKFSPGTRW